MTTASAPLEGIEEFDGRAAIAVPRQDPGRPIEHVEIEHATYEGAFVLVVHDAAMDVVGTSGVTPAGEHFAGSVELDSALTETQTVTVVVHHATDSEPGERVLIDGVIVLDNATVGPQEFTSGDER